MGTRSRIGVMHGDNVKSVYCHWDGYLEHNGAILLEHYNSSKANQLVSMGDMSSLGRVLGQKHPFSPFVEDTEEFNALPEEEQNLIKEQIKTAYDTAKSNSWCKFYGRDRGETGTEWQVATTFEAFLKQCDDCDAEYYYIMRDGEWYVGTTYENDVNMGHKLVPLAEAMTAVEEAA